MEFLLYSLAIIFVMFLMAGWVHHMFVTETTVYDHETALLYKKGEFVKELKPGHYKLLNFGNEIFKEDKRLRTTILAGQEILTKDNINIKISLLATWSLQDFKTANDITQNYYHDFYTLFQMTARNAAEKYTLDEILEEREKIADETEKELKVEAEKLGLSVERVGLRDIMLSAQLKKAYAGVIEARKKNERDLEITRGEQAVMRKLANFSKIIDDNPHLLTLRTLQTFSESDNVTVVLGQADHIASASSTSKKK